MIKTEQHYLLRDATSIADVLNYETLHDNSNNPSNREIIQKNGANMVLIRDGEEIYLVSFTKTFFQPWTMHSEVKRVLKKFGGEYAGTVVQCISGSFKEYVLVIDPKELETIERVKYFERSNIEPCRID